MDERQRTNCQCSKRPVTQPHLGHGIIAGMEVRSRRIRARDICLWPSPGVIKTGPEWEYCG